MDPANQQKRPLSRRAKAKRIRLGTYPYTVTRVRVMRSFLLAPADYLRMQQMGMNELVDTLLRKGLAVGV